MDTLKIDFGNITFGLLVLFVGLIALLASLFRFSKKDFSLFNFGLFSFLYGIRCLMEIPTMRTLIGFPFTFPYFHGLLTYALTIPFFALIVNIFGRGFYNSLLWLFYSTIVYALVAITIDILRSEALAEVSIYKVVVVIWCIVGITNVIFIRRKDDIELNVLKVAFLITLVAVTIDNVAVLRDIILGVSIEHFSFLILFIGLGFVAVHHSFANDRKLQNIQQEIEIARRIQQSNLPSSISVPSGIKISTKYVPMSAVGGDFYDVNINDNKGIGVFIADVSGHGIGAALIGSMLKISFASQTDNISNPAKVLTEINRILHGKLEESFVTACSVFIDIANKKLWYSCAGHPPPLLLQNSTKEIHSLSAGGMILTLFPDSIYENVIIDISHNDRLVLYTDGITETSDRNGELFGQERLEKFIQENSSYSTERAADLILEHLAEWSGKSRRMSIEDDLTIMIIDINLGET